MAGGMKMPEGLCRPFQEENHDKPGAAGRAKPSPVLGGQNGARWSALETVSSVMA